MCNETKTVFYRTRSCLNHGYARCNGGRSSAAGPKLLVPGEVGIGSMVPDVEFKDLGGTPTHLNLASPPTGTDCCV